MEMDNYNRGLRGFQRDIHQDYHEYSKGRTVREMTQGTDQPVSGGGGAGVLPIIFIFLPMALVTAIASVFSAFFLKVYVKMIEIEHKTLTYKEAFKILFKISLVYQIVMPIASFLVMGLAYLYIMTHQVEAGTDSFQTFARLIICSLFAIHIPSILITANILRKKLTFFLKFKGIAGYWRSAFFITFVMVIIPSLIIIGALYAVHMYVFPIFNLPIFKVIF